MHRQKSARIFSAQYLVLTIGLALVFALTFAFTAPTAVAKTQARWKASLYGRSTDDRFSSSRVVGLAGLLNVDHAVSDSLRARFVGGAALETGSSSALFTDEFEPRSRLLLQEASLRWRLFHPFTLMAGALDQRHHGSPLLVSGGTFPAALAALNPRWGRWVFHLDAQGAIPTSRSLSTRSVGKEPTPVLFTQKAVLGWEDKQNKVRAFLRMNHFQFRNLTRGAARDSRFYGNTITGVGNASAFFYEYEGFEGGPDITIPLGGRFSWSLGGSVIQNTKGPKNNNRGQYAYTDITYQRPGFSLRPRAELYRSEADSAPAFYTSAEFGHNNRQGVGAALRLETTKINFEAKAKRSYLIEPRTFQKDRFDSIELTVEIPYAGF